jgi:2-hydroxychromene-2-carboxylate isomerase
VTRAVVLGALAWSTVALGADVAAVVAGQPIPLAAVDARCGDPCARLRAAIAERKWTGLETLLDEALLASGPSIVTPPVDEAAIDAYLAEHAADFHGPPARDRAAVRAFLGRERRRAAKAERLGALRQSRPPRVFTAADDPALADDGTPARVLADVGGQPIRDPAVEARFALALYRLRGELARERIPHAEALVDDRLWTLEATERRTSVPALQAEVRASARVSDAEVETYYVDVVRARDPHAEKRPDRLRPYLEFRARHAAEQAFLTEQRRRRDARMLLAEPPPARLVLGAGSAGWRGPASPRVRVVFLTGFRAGSRDMWVVARRLAREPGVALAVRPLLPHWDREAADVAAAVRCASARGKQWALLDRVAGASALPDRAALDAAARAVGLDVRAFAVCVDDPTTADAVAAESAEAERLGLDAPPALLVDGRVFGGRQDPNELRALVRARP